MQVGGALHDRLYSNPMKGKCKLSGNCYGNLKKVEQLIVVAICINCSPIILKVTLHPPTLGSESFLN
jgi:hypothetical protein